MIVLGLDSATNCGWALLGRDGGREALIECGVLDLSIDAALKIEALANRAVDHGVQMVAIEDNYLALKPGKANPAVLKFLSRLVGRWEQAFERRRVPTSLVMPEEWARAVLTGLIHPHSKRDERKRSATTWARGTFGVRVTSDAADAIGIAAFAARRAGFAGKVQAARSVTPRRDVHGLG